MCHQWAPNVFFHDHHENEALGLSHYRESGVRSTLPLFFVIHDDTKLRNTPKGTQSGSETPGETQRDSERPRGIQRVPEIDFWDDQRSFGIIKMKREKSKNRLFHEVMK